MTSLYHNVRNLVSCHCFLTGAFKQWSFTLREALDSFNIV